MAGIAAFRDCHWHFSVLSSRRKKNLTYHLSRKDSEKFILAQGEFSGKKGSCDTSLFSLEIPVVHSHCMSIEENNRNKKKRVSRRDSQLDPIRVSRE